MLQNITIDFGRASFRTPVGELIALPDSIAGGEGLAGPPQET